MASILSLISKILISLIRIYQLVISPFLGNHCCFQLTCSQYSINVIKYFGVLKGSWLILKRLLKCHHFYMNSENSLKIETYSTKKNEK